MLVKIPLFAIIGEGIVVTIGCSSSARLFHKIGDFVHMSAPSKNEIWSNLKQSCEKSKKAAAHLMRSAAFWFIVPRNENRLK